MAKVILTILLALYINICTAQDFDRILEKDIKTAINLNRIAKSQNPLHLSSYHKKAADSINRIAYDSFIKHVVHDSRGYQENWVKIWEPVDAEFQKYFAHFNVLIIKDGNYEEELKREMLSREAYYYKQENYEVSLSAIRHGDKIFLTILTW